MIVKTFPGTMTMDQVSEWFRREAARRWASIVYVYGVQESRAACVAWLLASQRAREWNALFALRCREGAGERWILGTGG